MKLNLDKMNNVAPQAVTTAVMGVLDALQNHPAEAQGPAAALVFLEVCRRFGITPQDVMTVARNILAHAEETSPELQAVSFYVKEEMA